MELLLTDKGAHKRLDWLDALKGFGILTVVWLHCNGGYSLSSLNAYFIKWFVSFHMALFYVAAGYCSRNSKSVLITLKNKARSLLVPYLIWGVVIGLAMEYARRSVRGMTWAGLLTMVRNTLVFTPYNACWFLMALFGVYLLEAVMTAILKKLPKELAFCINAICHGAFVVIGYLLRDIKWASAFQFSKILVGSFFFWLGQMYVYLQGKKVAAIRRKSVKVIIALSCLLLGGLLAVLNEQVTFSRQIYGNPFMALGSALLSLYGLFTVFQTVAVLSKGRLLLFCGQNSMIILCTHSLFIYMFRLLEMVLKMEIHTFPVLIVFPIVVVMELALIKLMPPKLFFIFGKKALGGKHISTKTKSETDDSKIQASSSSQGDFNVNTKRKLNGTVIVTYRCNARCTMCNRYKAPSKPEEELTLETIRKLPPMYFTNITGGEPFIRTDLKDIVRELYKKSDRIVISTNGFFTDRIVDLAKEFPEIGIRISIEGLEKTNNEIRGLENGFQRGYETLKTLRAMGMKDVGFGMTVQDKNAPDLVPLYDLSNEMGMEFATASLHNSFYFVEAKNIIHDRPMVAKNFEDLINKLLRSHSPKKWFRAYFNHGLINYIYGQKRLLPCDMSFDTFFIDPYGDVMPCNGTKDKEVMGNLNRQEWDELWNSPEAEAVRKKVRACDRNCWMIGSVSPAMHKYILKPFFWVLRHKFKALFTKHPYSMYELKICRDLRDGKVTKEALDACSTCDLHCAANNGLSEASQAQLADRTGEEIVAADLAGQTEQK